MNDSKLPGAPLSDAFASAAHLAENKPTAFPEISPELSPDTQLLQVHEAPPSSTHLQLEIRTQPDEVTCGPTCLHAVYRYFGDNIALPSVVDEISQLKDGGTLACLLACHALKRGYKARIYTYDLKTFDPSWLTGNHAIIPDKLRQQMAVKDDPKLGFVSRAYLEYLSLGGQLRFEDLTRALIRRPLVKGLPMIVGLSSTYLYREMRDIPSSNVADDIRGLPGGHFVVLHGYDHIKRTVYIADPYGDNPLTGSNGYEIPIDRVICAILLGIVTYDANLLILEPRDRKQRVSLHGPRGTRPPRTQHSQGAASLPSR